MLLKKVYQATLTYHAINISVPIIEKPRFLDLVTELSSLLSARVIFWDIIQALESKNNVKFNNNLEVIISSIVEAISLINKSDNPTILVLENIQGFLDSSKVDFTTTTYLRHSLFNAIADFKTAKNKYLILLDTENNLLPSSMRSIVPTLDYPLPDQSQVLKLISETLQLNGYKVDNDLVERAAIASLGLSNEEVSTALRLALLTSFEMVGDKLPKFREKKRAEDNKVESLSSSGGDSAVIIEPFLKLNPEIDKERLIDRIVSYKKARLRETGLEFMPPPDVKDFGGLDRLKAAIERVKKDFSPQAREFNLPIPKGWLLVGPPGTGKTFSAKVCASSLGFPLISIGVDSVLAGGANYLKKLLLRIDAVGGAIAYFDEFDKFFADINDSRTKEVLGVLLTWLAEKTSKTFVMATLNRFDNLPAELTRAGRFDRIWYVDFPHDTERYHIFTIHLSRFDRRYSYDGNIVKSPLSDRDWQILLKETVNFTGAEIRTLVEDSARDCFYDGRDEINLVDLLTVRSHMTSLFARDPESICAMANRAKKHATPASSRDSGLFAPTPVNYWGETIVKS